LARQLRSSMSHRDGWKRVWRFERAETQEVDELMRELGRSAKLVERHRLIVVRAVKDDLETLGAIMAESIWDRDAAVALVDVVIDQFEEIGELVRTLPQWPNLYLPRREEAGACAWDEIAQRLFKERASGPHV